MRARFRVDWGALVRRLPAAALMLVVCLFLAWLVVKNAVVNSFARSYPKVAASVAPHDPRVATAMIARDLQAHLAVPRPSSTKLARRALLRAPLSDDPFLLGGIEHLLRRDYRGAAPLITRALARNPRSRVTRLFMLDLELRSRRAEAAASDMTILSRLLPDVQKVFMPELAKFARDPATRGPLRQALRTDPAMHNSLLFYLASHGSNPAVVLDLAGAHPPRPASPDSPDWRRALLDSMVAKGDLERAFRLWAAGARLPANAQPGLYDGNFQRLPGSPPFNWTFASSDMGVAEPAKRGGLEVEYYGRTAGELASQLLLLSPGRYRLSFHAEGDLSGQQHRMIWRVLCQDQKPKPAQPAAQEASDAPDDLAIPDAAAATAANAKPGVLLELPLANITYAGRNVAADFTVPPQCRAQWLKLFGEPTEFPKIENVTISAMKLQRMGSAK